MIKIDSTEYGYEGKAYSIKKVSVFGLPIFTSSRSTQSKNIVAQFVPVKQVSPVIGFKNEENKDKSKKNKRKPRD